MGAVAQVRPQMLNLLHAHAKWWNARIMLQRANDHMTAETTHRGERVGPAGIVTRLGGSAQPVFSICTMVTNWDEYDGCMASFARGGFDHQSCEFIVLDNTVGNRADGYVALNEFLQAAAGRYVLICHQDVVLIEHGRVDLERRLAELDQIDPHWAVCGNAGYTAEGWPVLNLSHPANDRDVLGTPFPVRVVSLDENFLLVRRGANLAVSRDLSGFHHYAVDLCTVADILGWNSYVIDFFLRHNSGGTLDASYDRSRDAITAKYARALRPRWAHVITLRPFLLSGSRLHHRLSGVQRRLGKLLGIYPRDGVLGDPAKRPSRSSTPMRAE